MPSGRVSTSFRSNNDQLNKKKRSFLFLYTEDEHPDLKITLEQFEHLGKKRFQLLKFIEKYRAEGKPLDEDDCKSKAEKDNFDYQTGLAKKEEELDLADADNDKMSHFILRLACCGSDESSKWFVTHETILFERRYVRATGVNEHLKIPIHKKLKIKDDQVDKFRLLNQFSRVNGKTPIPLFHQDRFLGNEDEILPFHRVLFSEVCDLVGRRGVFLLNGFAWVPHDKFHSYIRGRFRSCLNKAMALMKRAHTIQRMRSDETASRLVPILESIPKLLDKSYTKSKLVQGNVTVASLGRLKKHMPLCMQLIIEEDCMKKRYVRHWGMLHLSLFLKGIGLPLVEATKFWRRSMKEEKKFKEIAGGLKHAYGTSGSKKDYSPFSCYKLVESVADKVPEKNCHYGCPFRYYNDKRLANTLRTKKVSDKDIIDIIKLKKGKHFELACKKVMESTHRDILQKNNQTIDDIENTWSHPNRYFDASYYLYNPDAKPKDDEIKKTEPENMTQQPGEVRRKPVPKFGVKKTFGTPGVVFGSKNKPKFGTACKTKSDTNDNPSKPTDVEMTE